MPPRKPPCPSAKPCEKCKPCDTCAPRAPDVARDSASPASAPTAAPASPTIPTTPNELHTFLSGTLKLNLPTAPLIPGHTAPFSYIAHAFFADHNPGVLPHAAPADCIVWANRGGGKTFLGALATFLDLAFKPGIEIRILGGSLDQSRRMYSYLRRLLSPHDPTPALADIIDRLAPTFTARRITCANHAAVELLSQSHTSVRGTRIQKLRLDEVDLFDPDVFEAAQLTTRSESLPTMHIRGTVECLSTMHVPHGLMHTLVAQAKPVKDFVGPPRWSLFKWGVVDSLAHCGPGFVCGEVGDEAHACPLLLECGGKAKDLTRTPGHIEIADAIASKARVSRAVWNTEMLCLRPSRSSAVLPEFDHAVHVKPPAEIVWVRNSDLVAGMDFGFRSPTVILWAMRAPDQSITVFAEHVESGQLIEAQATLLLEPPPNLPLLAPTPAPPLRVLGVDPAGNHFSSHSGKSSVQILRACGINVASQGSKIKDGLERIRVRFRPADPSKPPRLIVSAACPKLIESLERYHYDPTKPESETPVKDGHDHAIDALRYMLINIDRPMNTSLHVLL